MTERRNVVLGSLPTLLRPKFMPPLERETYVRRQRLHERLARASSTQITLVSAPAGCGKTALVAAWLGELPDDRRAWLSLDDRDNDPVRMWAHVIEALRGLSVGVSERALAELVRSGGQGPVDRWIAPLVNDLVAERPPTSYLVIDDFHVITDPELRASVALFVANMPTWLRLIFVTRADPPLPWARLRAEGRLTEIRQSHLKFDSDEAAQLFRAEGIETLDDDQLEWLMARTEGWAAGLQLAAIVIGDDASSGRLQEVAGSNVTFADYIVSEVVDVAPDELRRFLFSTSVLDRFSPSLAQEVSGFDDAGQTLLREAQQRGLFLVALDEKGEWFRYHHLFAEAIHAEARSRDPGLVRSANEHAATWFERHGDLVSALDHWFAAERPEEAFRIALEAGYQLIDSGQVKSVERIATLIPPGVVGTDPRRQLDYAMLHNHIDADIFVSWVNEAAKTIDAQQVTDDALVQRYHSVRALCHLLLGEWDEATSHAHASIDPLGVGEGESALTQRAGLQLMRALGWMEDPAAAERILRTYAGSPWTSPVVRNLIAPCTWALAAAIGGRMDESELAYSSVMAIRHHVPVPQAAQQELLLSRVLICTERADTASALVAIDELRATYVRTYHSLRAIAEAEVAVGLAYDERFADATSVLEALAEQMHPSLGPRVLDAIDRAWTELHLCTGDLTSARESARRMRIGFWRDATRAKVLTADGEPQRAVVLLGSLSPTSPRQEVTRLLLHANSLASDEHGAQLAMTEEALTRASAHGMLQTVVAASRGLVTRLEPASSVVPETWMNEVRRLLAKGGRGTTPGRVPTLYEQPTERERMVARYLPSRLTIPEIARELDITPNTLKSHVKSLYRKLGVTSREEAVATARRLGIIG